MNFVELISSFFLNDPRQLRADPGFFPHVFETGRVCQPVLKQFCKRVPVSYFFDTPDGVLVEPVSLRKFIEWGN